MSGDLFFLLILIVKFENRGIILGEKGAKMPVYEYIVADTEKGCDLCSQGFELIQSVKDETLVKCPECGADIRKIFPHISVGASKTTLDRRAKDNGFHKLKKVDKNKYEKLY